MNKKKDNPKNTFFQTVWRAGEPGELPPEPLGYKIAFGTRGNCTINWGDGATQQAKNVPGHFNIVNHYYKKPGDYTVNISNGITGFSTDYSDKPEKLIEIKQWGNAQWETMWEMFCNAYNLVCTATDTPNTSNVTNMERTFYNCFNFNSPIEHWDFSQVETMFSMLSNATTFNQSLTKMDLRRVLDMGFMLDNTRAFNQDLRELVIHYNAKTNDMFGPNKSLEQYNAMDEKQDVIQTLR